MTTTFDRYLGRIRNGLDPVLVQILEDLASGNTDRDQVTGGLTVQSITYAHPYTLDEQVALAGINPVGPATAPTEDPAGEGWLFSGVTTDNVAVIGRQINHNSEQGTVTIVPHIHWRKTTAAAGNVVWRLEYKLAAVGGDFGDYVQVGTDQKTPIAATVDNSTATRHLITSFGNLSIPVGLSTKIFFKLTRVASDTINDTYNADALAMSFDYHFRVDSPGSSEEYRK